MSDYTKRIQAIISQYQSSADALGHLNNLVNEMAQNNQLNGKLLHSICQQFKEKYLKNNPLFKKEGTSNWIDEAELHILAAIMQRNIAVTGTQFTSVINGAYLKETGATQHTDPAIAVKLNGGHYYRETPNDTQGDGLCGFHAIAAGLNDIQAQDSKAQDYPSTEVCKSEITASYQIDQGDEKRCKAAEKKVSGLKKTQLIQLKKIIEEGCKCQGTQDYLKNFTKSNSKDPELVTKENKFTEKGLRHALSICAKINPKAGELINNFSKQPRKPFFATSAGKCSASLMMHHIEKLLL